MSQTDIPQGLTDTPQGPCSSKQESDSKQRRWTQNAVKMTSFHPALGYFVGSEEESVPFRNHLYLLFETVLWGILDDHRTKSTPKDLHMLLVVWVLIFNN